MQNLPIIFLAFANDKQTADGFLRNLTLERNQIREALKQASAGQNPVCEVIVEPDASIDSIFDTFQNPEYRDRIAVFHYGGHAENFKLLLESAHGKKVEAHAEGLVPFIASQKGLQLVFLNGCSTQSQADALISEGVPAVIGTTKNIPDQVAQALSQRFYAGLGAGLSLQNAWNEAVLYLKSQSGREVKSILRAHEEVHDTFPWYIRYSNNSGDVREWNLPEAAGNPVFGLPELDQKYFLHLPPSPYLGLKRFEQQDAGIFFGRNAEVRKLIDKIQSIYPVILYYGQSGIGKSSLLEAGLIPRLEVTHHCIVIRHLHEQGLVHQLFRGLHDLLGREMPEQIPGPEKAIELWKEAEQVHDKPLVCVFDQFEEVYIKSGVHPETMWDDFCRYLKPLSDALCDSKAGKIIISFRSEYLPQIQDALSKHRIAKTDLLLSPIGKTGMVEAITGAATHTRTADFYHFHADQIEPELTDKIVSDLRQDLNSPIAPMLQILLTKLWDRALNNKSGDKLLTLDLYYEIHKEGIALRDFIEMQLATLKGLENVPESPFYKTKVESSGLVLDVLVQFITRRNTTDAVALTTLLVRYPDHQNVLPALIAHLVDARVLSVFEVEGRQQVSLVHDTLAPVVHELYELSDRPGQRARGILEGKIHSGQVEGHLDVMDLAQVEDGLSGMRALTDEETELLQRSRLERNKALKRQKGIKIVGITAAILILAFGLAATFFWSVATRHSFEAKKNLLVADIRAYEAETNRIAAQSFGAFVNDNTTGINLAIEAATRHLNKETGLALSVVTEKAGPLYHVTFAGHEQAVFAACFAPDGQSVVTGSQDKTTKLWDLEGNVLMTFSGHTEPVTAVNFSPDGQYILTCSWDGTAKLWDRSGVLQRTYLNQISSGASTMEYLVSEGREVFKEPGMIEKYFDVYMSVPHTYARNKHALTSAIFTPDGENIVLAGADNNAYLFSLDGRLLQIFIGHTAPVIALVCSPDGRYLFTGSQDNSGKLWTIGESFFQDQDFIGHNGGIYSADFSPDGQTIVTGSWDQSMILWDLKGNKLKTYINQDYDQGVMDRGVMSVAFSPDGKYILEGSYDFRARLWSLDGKVVSTFLGHEKAVIVVAFSPGGESILTASEDGTAKLWRLHDKRVQVFHQGDAAVLSATYAPDGKSIVVGSADHQARLLDRNGNLIHHFTGHARAVHAVAFSPDGAYVLTGSEDSTAILWTKEGEYIRTFSGHEGAVNCVLFTHDGERILTGSDDQTTILWNIDGSIEKTFDPMHRHPNPGPHTNDPSNNEGPVNSIAISPDNSKVFVGHAGFHALLWDINGGVLQVFDVLDEVFGVAFSPDGKSVFTASKDQRARKWGLDGVLTTLYLGHKGPVTSIAIDSSGQYVLTGSDDQTVKLWTMDGDEIQTFGRFGSGVTSVAFAPDNKYILTGSYDHTVREWLRWEYYRSEHILGNLSDQQLLKYRIW